MKKSRLIATAVAFALTFGAVPVRAESAIERFNDKVKAFKKGYKKGTLTRRQKVALAVAVGAAAMAVITGAGYGLEAAGSRMVKGRLVTPSARTMAGGAIETTGRAMTYPARKTGRVLGTTYEATRAAARRGAAAARQGAEAARERFEAAR